MDEKRKAAYRYLLYWFCLELRSTAPWGRDGWEAFWSLFKRYSRIKTLHYAHALGEAFHNLADFSHRDFIGFDEEHFWRIDMGIQERYTANKGLSYRKIFDDYLKQNS